MVPLDYNNYAPPGLQAAVLTSLEGLLAALLAP